jgi:hypothetical protein
MFNQAEGAHRGNAIERINQMCGKSGSAREIIIEPSQTPPGTPARKFVPRMLREGIGKEGRRWRCK